MKVPIPNTINNQLDPSYRYTRDSLTIVKQGQFYVLDNIGIISKQLKVSISDISKYLTTKLNQPVLLDKKNNTLKIKTLPTDFEQYFEEFIKKFIICNNCNKPELNSNKICDCCGTNNLRLVS
jgi:translation initiation factor 2 beta subunit (eIF-2beta)/eIF-5